MTRWIVGCIAIFAVIWIGVAALAPSPQPQAEQPYPAGAKARFVEVEKGVKLEVVDFGGSGRPVLLLAGLGGTAHSYDQFARYLLPRYHVWSMTRRGFGASSVPGSGYSAQRLGEDVVAVMDAVGLTRPVLIGHSMAGEELSAVATYHPGRAAGLVYLDAGYAYALRNPAHDRLKAVPYLRAFESLLPPPLRRPKWEIFGGAEKFSRLPLPVLAIFADPHDGLTAKQDQGTEWQAQAFETMVPTARVVRLPHASHMVYQSHRAEVVREIDAFIASLMN